MKPQIIVLIFLLFNISCAQLRYATIKPIVLRQIPHDRDAFTQGIVLHEDYLYESTGLFGKSTIRQCCTWRA